MQAERYDVFISYSSADSAWVRGELLAGLETAGLRVCIDFRDFERGAPSVAEMERAVRESRRTLLVLTPAYLASGWAAFEALMLQTRDPANRERRLIPLLRERCELPLRIGYLTYVDFATPENQRNAWTQLLTALGAPPPAQAPEEPSRDGWLLAHPYGMPPNFTGRDAECALLSEWLGDGERRMLALRALGGFGKSALCWRWLLHDVAPARWPRVVWWSFYENNAGFESFLPAVLAYLGGDPQGLGPRQQADDLLRRLHSPGVLLVLDGFERALRAYSGMGAAYQGDEPDGDEGRTARDEGRKTKDESATAAHRPPATDARRAAPDPRPLTADPWSPASGERDAERDCVSPVAEHFLRGVCALPGMRGKVLLTTRLLPRILEAHGGALLEGCREVELTQMQPADAVAFFGAQGIRGTRAEVERACARYGYHPLSLRLLAGLVAADPRQPGDIAAARSLDVSGDLVQRKNHVLAQAYAGMTPERRSLLSRIACFRGPVGYDALAALAQKGKHKAFDAALRDLVARGLLHHDRRAGRYDLHPIVRRYAYDRLDGSARTSAHRRLRDYFAAIPPPARPQRLDELAPLIELYHHMARAGQYDEAFALFRDRIHGAAYYQFGAYRLLIELLRALFPDGEEHPPRLSELLRAQSWTLTALANSYSLSGQPRRAVPLYELGNDIQERRGDKQNLAIGLGNLADDQMKVGAFSAAEANLRRRIALCREIEDEFREAIGHAELGRLLAYQGAWGAAELEAALALFDKGRNVQSQEIIWAYRALQALLMLRELPSPSPAVAEELRAAALEAARRAIDLAEEDARTTYPVERDYVRAHWLLGAAQLANGDLASAERHLDEALARCRGINAVDAEADILLDLARLRAASGERAEALRLAQEALIIAERSGYALQSADIHLFLAVMALAAQDSQGAARHAGEARRLARCDGPPDHTYRVAYEEAGAILERLGQSL